MIVATSTFNLGKQNHHIAATHAEHAAGRSTDLIASTAISDQGADVAEH